MALALLDMGHCTASRRFIPLSKTTKTTEPGPRELSHEIPSGELQPSIAAFRSALAAAELAGEPVAARFAEVGLWRRTARGEGRSAPKHRGEYAARCKRNRFLLY